MRLRKATFNPRWSKDIQSMRCIQASCDAPVRLLTSFASFIFQILLQCCRHLVSSPPKSPDFAAINRQDQASNKFNWASNRVQCHDHRGTCTWISDPESWWSRKIDEHSEYPTVPECSIKHHKTLRVTKISSFSPMPMSRQLVSAPHYWCTEAWRWSSCHRHFSAAAKQVAAKNETISCVASINTWQWGPPLWCGWSHSLPWDTEQHQRGHLRCTWVARKQQLCDQKKQ